MKTGALIESSTNQQIRLIYIIIRKLGALAMTGMGINFPFMSLIMAFSSLVRVGAAAIISIRLGENRKMKAMEPRRKIYLSASISAYLNL